MPATAGEPAPTTPLLGAEGLGVLFEAMPDALIGVDRTGVIRVVNRQAEALFGYDRDALVGQLVETLLPESFRMAHQTQRQGYVADPKTRSMGTGAQFVGMRRDGTELPVDLSLSPVQTGEGLLVIAAVRDLTARNAAEEDRRRSDLALAAMQFSGDAIMLGTLDGVVTRWNQSAETMFGYTSGEMVGQSAIILSPKDGAHEVGSVIAEIISGQPVAKVETIAVRKDGTVFPIQLTASAVYGQDGALVGTSAIARDVSEQQEKFEATQRMAAIVENSDDAIIGKTLDGVITSWNPAAERMYGYTSDEITGRSIDLLSPVGGVEEVRSILARIRDGQQVERLDTVRVRKDGTTLTVSLTVSPIHHPDGTVVGASTIARDVTETRLAFEAARSMIESSLDSMVAISPEGRITDVNEATVKVTGIPRDELIGTAFSDYFTEPEKANAIYQLVFTHGMAVDYPLTMRHRDGTLTEVLYNASVYRDAGGDARGVFAAARDVTEQKRAAEIARSLVAAEDLVRTVMASASIGIALTDSDGFFRVVNQSLCGLLGYDEAWFLAHRLHDMVHPGDLPEVLKESGQIFAGSLNAPAAILRLVRADGATVWARRVAVLIRDADGDPNLLMVQVEDITAEHDAQEALAYQAFHDPMTGLHNRAWVLDILKADLLAAKRLGTSVAALFVDVDNLKVVNDSLGHAAGDEVLTIIANRIGGALRPEDRVGRFGGDEFVIVVQNVVDALEVERFAERVSTAIATDLVVRGHRIVPTASIGIALSTASSTPETLLRDTGSAMFRAKADGRARWQFFDDAMHAHAVARLTVEDQLRDAIIRKEFVVYYQPIVALADACVVGHEALVRWAHPTRGLLAPGAFLDVAEDSGLIRAIGAQVLDQACAMLAARPDLPGPISVNVSAVQLSSPDWLGAVIGALAAHQVDPARLVVEVTETAALSMTGSALHALESLRGLGVGIHLDDFGTGYSSISVLRDLPVTGVKLDLRFVRDLITGNSQANALANGLSGLVNRMHLTGIAEGIETEMQAHILRAQGWECGQGDYFGRPAAMPVAPGPSLPESRRAHRG
jgi:diguanylate cyclase (GGDEF)-like protein/PAS domain S-box-containing protein